MRNVQGVLGCSGRNYAGQRKNLKWAAFRRGRITATNFGPVLKNASTSRAPSQSLMKTLLGGYDPSGVHAVQWGQMHEDIAIALYEKENMVEVEKTGIWLSTSGKLGASPDGFIRTDTIIEVKCPYSARSTTLADLASKKYF